MFAAWHQDATYFGLDLHEHVTAWLALNDASAEAGCMEVVSSRGAPRQLRHAALGLEHSINGGGQAIVEDFDREDTVMMALAAGEFSLHHTLARQPSAPNRAGHRRIGLGSAISRRGYARSAHIGFRRCSCAAATTAAISTCCPHPRANSIRRRSNAAPRSIAVTG